MHHVIEGCNYRESNLSYDSVSDAAVLRYFDHVDM